MLPSLSLSANYSPYHPRSVRKLGKPQLLGDSHLKTETRQTRCKITSTSETKMNTMSNTTPHNTPVPRRRTCTSPTHAPRSHRHPGPHRNLLQVASSRRSSRPRPTGRRHGIWSSSVRLRNNRPQPKEGMHFRPRMPDYRNVRGQLSRPRPRIRPFHYFEHAVG